VLGRRVTEVVGDIVARREDLLKDAMDVLRLQYPGYAEALEGRMLRQIGLRLESEEYIGLKRESLIGEELHDELLRGLETLRRQVARPLQFNIQSGVDGRIKEFEIFSGLQDALLHDLAMSVTTRFAVPGERIYREGQAARSVFLISRGVVVMKGTAPGSEEILLTTGEFFGEAELLADRPRRAERARANSFCHLLELDIADFQRLLNEAPDLAVRMERSARARAPVRDDTPAGLETAHALKLVGFDQASKPVAG
jgi:CPA1 family monovalent cation:H+ antiporter